MFVNFAFERINNQQLITKVNIKKDIYFVTQSPLKSGL